MIKYPVVSFTYLQLEQFSVLEEIFSSNTEDEIKGLHDRYVLFAHEKNKLHHDCPMFEYLLDDINESKVPFILDNYHRLVKKYGKDLVDLLVVSDENTIKNKIIKLLDFTFNNVYDADIIRVEFLRYGSPSKDFISIPSIIYEAIEENYDIINKQLTQQCWVNIRRRGE